MLRASDLEYRLPPEAIATSPASPRDSARLLVVSRSSVDAFEHAQVADLCRFIKPADLLVFNDTRVLPARLRGRKVRTGGAVEGLYLGEASGETGRRWRVLLRGDRLRPGTVVELLDDTGRESGAALELIGNDAGTWTARVSGDDAADTPAMLERIGATPIPPYIAHARRRAGLQIGDALDRAWYQTVYASPRAAGSVAAPTAGLHFTPQLLARLDAGGVRRATVTLHVGAGTFKPVETEFVEAHPMHEEWFEAPGATLGAMREARAAGGRIIAVGTTAARALESIPEAPSSLGADGAARGSTRLLITPGYRFTRIDGLLTNFHLPRSTLLALVAALLEPVAATPSGEGVRRTLALYAEAIAAGYRFYSYGDAMLILP